MSNRLTDRPKFLRLKIFSLIILLAGFTSVPAGAFGQNLEALDAQNGFLEVRLGAALDTLKGFEKFGSRLKKDRYRCGGCPKSYAGVRFSEIEFLFYKNRLHSIVLNLNGEKDSQAFLELLKLFYGDGVQLGMAPNYTWEGKVVKLTYEQNLFTKNTVVVFESVEVQRFFSQEYRIR